MNRRQFLKSSALVSAATAASARQGKPERTPASAAGRDANRNASSAGPRQAVVILGEAVRWDMLNCYRATGLRTPNLDRLAAGGIRLERAYCVQPVCAPSRSAIWTGQTPHTNGVWGNSMPLGDTVASLGQRLHDDGVPAAFIGKWHLDGFDYFGTGRAAPGWDADRWYDMRNYLTELSPQDRVRSRDPRTADDATWPAERCYAHRCADRAVAFLEDHRSSDFLLCVAFDEPHDPSLCPVQYSSAYASFTFPPSPNLQDSLQDKPVEQRIWAGRERLGTVPGPIREKHFFGCHTFVDAQIGRILDAVDRLAPGALVVYTSDHGYFLESHRLYGKGPAMYDEITRVPFLARWPGHIPEGVVNPHPASLLDLSGTVLEFFGREVPRTFEGGSMLGALVDPGRPARDVIFMEWGRYEVDHDGFGGFQPIRAVFDGRFKLNINLMVTDELYDLQRDPGELHNLIKAPEFAATRNRLHDRILDWMNTTRDPFRGYYWGRRPWRPDFPVSWNNAGMTRQRESDGYLPRELDYDTGMPMVTAVRNKSS